MQHLDRNTALALAEAGYLSLSEYIEMFSDQPTAVAQAPQERPAIGHHRTRRWSVPAHFASPIRRGRYQLTDKKSRSAA